MLHVEIAIPTAMVLSSEKIITKDDINLKSGAIWTTSELQSVGKQFNYDIPLLLDTFPINKLYLLPIKLSKWKNDSKIK